MYSCDEPHFFPENGDPAGNWPYCVDKLEADRDAWPEIPKVVTTHVQSVLEHGISQRVAAYQRRHGSPPAAMRFVAAPFALLEAVDVGELADAIRTGGGTQGAHNFWWKMSGGATATLFLGAADAWNAPWPHLEIIGTQGRSLVCQAGRRVGLLVPREATRWWEPPGLAPHVSAANIAGLGEDIKAFLATCVGTAPLVGAETVLGEPGRALTLCQAAQDALQSGEMQFLTARPWQTAPTAPQPTPRPSENLTLEFA